MNDEIWQRLLTLESRDGIDKAFTKIHGRTLNAKRSKEISAATRQAREFFRNADAANFSVRPLLTFYGVACLARALVLLLRKEGGEESLTRGHGLEAVGWSNTLSGTLSAGLGGLGSLKVRTCAGLFSDLVRGTGNRLCFHVRSSAVDWRLNYPSPELGHELTLTDLLERVPDLRPDYASIGGSIRYADVSEMAYSAEAGLKLSTRSQDFAHFQQCYSDAGFAAVTVGTMTTITASEEVFSKNIPQFMHSCIKKSLGSIPDLYIVEPFLGSNRYSQISITYLMAYFLGMLARYYPTHWISLIQGEKGDNLWPTLNRAQHFVEHSFPELAIELIDDVLAHGR